MRSRGEPLDLGSRRDCGVSGLQSERDHSSGRDETRQGQGVKGESDEPQAQTMAELLR